MLCRRMQCVLLAAIMWGAAMIGSAAAAEQQTPVPPEKVAVVNGSVISGEDFQRELGAVQQRFAGFGQQLSEAQQSELEKAVLEKLIETKLLYQAAKEAGINVDDQAVSQELDQLRAKFPDQEKFKQTLAMMQVSEDQLKDQIKQGLTINKFIEQKFMEKTTVSDEQAKAYYESNQAEFQQPEMVRASHILVTVPEGADQAAKDAALAKIKGIQQQLENGADFGELAKQNSDCPSSAQGGDLGFFKRGQMVPAFEKAAFDLKPGEMSPIVETQFGYHLIKLTEKKPASTVAFDEVKGRLQEFLQQRQVKEEVQSYLADLKQKAKIERFLQVG